jgi:Tetratricopeptide repeat/FecR protein
MCSDHSGGGDHHHDDNTPTPAQLRLRQVVKLDNDAADQIRAGNYTAAVQLLRQALSLDNHRGMAYYNLAIALDGLGDFKGALDAVQLAIKYHKNGQVNLADARAELARAREKIALQHRESAEQQSVVVSEPTVTVPAFTTTTIIPGPLRHAYKLNAVHSDGMGNFSIYAPDGRKLDAAELTSAEIGDGARVVTGSNTSVTLTFPDDTTFTISENSEVTLDTFEYDVSQANTVENLQATLMIGIFRWVTGHVMQHNHNPQLRVVCPQSNCIDNVGIRGTDLEASIDGPDVVLVLISGEIDVQVPARAGVAADEQTNCTAKGPFTDLPGYGGKPQLILFLTAPGSIKLDNQAMNYTCGTTDQFTPHTSEPESLQELQKW